MNREDYGTCWTNDAEDVREFSGPTADFAGKPDDQRGFRLAHDSASRVLRGGSWRYTADLARAANRRGYYPGYSFGSLGFRLVREET
jgi:hypothetical protein